MADKTDKTEKPTPETVTPPPEAVALPTVKVGDLVHVTLDRGPLTGECRAAIVVRVFGGAVINAQMFTDGVNDHEDYASGLVRLTGLHFALPVEDQPTPPQTWHLAHE